MSLKNVNVKTAYQLQSNEGCTYVDVRSVPEYDSGHPQGAQNVPLLHRDATTGQMMPNPDFLSVMQENYSTATKLLIGCQMGGRSLKAAQLLISAGYEDVTNVQGGFGGGRNPQTGEHVEGWADAGLPVTQESETGANYDSLHKKKD